jgi:isoquinoline 1-oxidoreductase
LGKPVVPPVRYGATVKSVDDSAAKKVKGFVKAVTVFVRAGHSYFAAAKPPKKP